MILPDTATTTGGILGLLPSIFTPLKPLIILLVGFMVGFWLIQILFDILSDALTHKKKAEANKQNDD